MSFNLQDFMDTTVDAPMETTYPVHPEGEFAFMFDADPKMLEVKNIKGTSASGKDYDFHQWELICISQDDKVKADMGRDKVTIRCRVNLDFDENGRLATGTGKNVLLGQIREALDQNKPGWKPSMLLGAGPFIGRVKQTEGKDGRKYSDVVAVAKYR